MPGPKGVPRSFGRMSSTKPVALVNLSESHATSRVAHVARNEDFGFPHRQSEAPPGALVCCTPGSSNLGQKISWRQETKHVQTGRLDGGICVSTSGCIRHT